MNLSPRSYRQLFFLRRNERNRFSGPGYYFLKKTCMREIKRLFVTWPISNPGYYSDNKRKTIQKTWCVSKIQLHEKQWPLAEKISFSTFSHSYHTKYFAGFNWRNKQKFPLPKKKKTVSKNYQTPGKRTRKHCDF